MEQQLFDWMDQIEQDLLDIRTHLFNNPELGDREFIAQETLVSYLNEHAFTVETGLVERPTSFRATYQGEKEGPTIGIMAEYDALPGVGHGCGHNLIATMGIGAGILLSKVI